MMVVVLEISEINFWCKISIYIYFYNKFYGGSHVVTYVTLFDLKTLKLRQNRWYRSISL